MAARSESDRVRGGAGLNLQLTGQVDIAGAGDQADKLFAMLQAYPGFTIVGILTILLVAIFFITGAETGAMVLGMLSSHGTPEPRRSISIIWGATTGAVALVLIYVGGLQAIETFVILAATPFIIVMAGMAVSFFIDLRHDPLRQQINPPVRQHAPDPTDSSAAERESVTPPAEEVTRPTPATVTSSGDAGGGSGGTATNDDSR